jgi:glutamate--cysteine ligase
LLDTQRNDQQHTAALATQKEKLLNPALTPSARVLAALQTTNKSFEEFGLQQSLKHAEYFRQRPLSAEENSYFEALAKTSIAEQEEMERTQTGDFDAFVLAYSQRTPRQLCD